MTLAALFFLIMWPIARLRLAGLSKEERARPVTGWRSWLFHPVVWLLSRAVFFSLGFLWVKVKGRRADLKDAPVLVVAPHSSFLDMLVLCPTQLATVVSRSENTSLPVIGGAFLAGVPVQPVLLRYPNKLVSGLSRDKGRVVNDYLQPEEVCSQLLLAPAANGKAVNNNVNGSLYHNKKFK
ncbi:hypothetical protein XENOCAPTIV_003344 [Xenoophorus captivus]|uniref:Lysophosphatidylcholine acyltransferase 4 n=1 Tax=Xenoophorus captivus TaxID=1517983 RepID=A0ABV0QUT3_9TELE